MKIYHLGIVGLGGIANSFAQNLSLENVLLAGCASRNYEKAQRFAKEHQITKAYETYEDMLLDDTIDAVYISVPNKQHYEFAKKALEAKKHVLCEKAITTNLEELEDLMALAQKNNVILQEAMTIFHMPLFKQIKRWVKGETFGKLQMIHAPFGSYMEPDPNNRYFSKELGGGALLDIGTYATSFFRYLLDETPELLSTTMIPFETGVDEKSVSVFKTSQNQLITMPLSFQGRMPKVGVLTFEKAYLTIPEYPRSSKVTITYNDRHEETQQIGDSALAFNYEVSDFIEAIETGKNEALFYTHETMKLMNQLMEVWSKA